MPDALTAAERERFVALADVMLPGTEGLPSASGVALGDALLDRVLEIRPDLEAPLRAEIAAADGGDPAAAVAAAMADPARGGVLAVAVFGAYYLSPEARAASGYAGHRIHAIKPDENDGLQELLAPVVQRGPIHRTVA
jgi:hypothetical protein